MQRLPRDLKLDTKPVKRRWPCPLRSHAVDAAAAIPVMPPLPLKPSIHHHVLAGVSLPEPLHSDSAVVRAPSTSHAAVDKLATLLPNGTALPPSVSTPHLPPRIPPSHPPPPAGGSGTGGSDGMAATSSARLTFSAGAASKATRGASSAGRMVSTPRPTSDSSQQRQWSAVATASKLLGSRSRMSFSTAETRSTGGGWGGRGGGSPPPFSIKRCQPVCYRKKQARPPRTPRQPCTQSKQRGQPQRVYAPCAKCPRRSWGTHNTGQTEPLQSPLRRSSCSPFQLDRPTHHSQVVSSLPLVQLCRMRRGDMVHSCAGTEP